MTRPTLGLAALAGTLAAVIALTSSWTVITAKDKTNDAALERTRNQVRMLDDIYKTVVVLITDKYVHDEDDFSAGSAAAALFRAVEKKGWHKVRLLDATGEPRRQKNTAKDDFEKAAVAAIKSGKSYYEKVVSKDGERHLRALTSIPVVSEKCVMCHANYKDAKPGEAIGAISYTLKVE